MNIIICDQIENNWKVSYLKSLMDIDRIYLQGELPEHFEKKETNLYIACQHNPSSDFWKKINRYEVNYPNIIHPTAQIGLDVKLGHGIWIMEKARIMKKVQIGNHCFIDAHAKLSSYLTISDYCEAHSGCFIGPFTQIKNNCVIGANATVSAHRTILENTTVGAATALLQDYPEDHLIQSRPSRRLPASSRSINSNLSLSHFQTTYSEKSR